MAKVKNGYEALITREQFNELRKMDRVETEAFLRVIFEKGYTKGYKEAEIKLCEDSRVSKKANIRGEIVSFLSSIPGFGPATLRKIKEALEKWCEPDVVQ